MNCSRLLGSSLGRSPLLRSHTTSRNDASTSCQYDSCSSVNLSRSFMLAICASLNTAATGCGGRGGGPCGGRRRYRSYRRNELIGRHPRHCGGPVLRPLVFDDRSGLPSFGELAGDGLAWRFGGIYQPTRHHNCRTHHDHNHNAQQSNPDHRLRATIPLNQPLPMQHACSIATLDGAKYLTREQRLKRQCAALIEPIALINVSCLV